MAGTARLGIVGSALQHGFPWNLAGGPFVSELGCTQASGPVSRLRGSTWLRPQVTSRMGVTGLASQEWARHGPCVGWNLKAVAAVPVLPACRLYFCFFHFRTASKAKIESL